MNRTRVSRVAPAMGALVLASCWIAAAPEARAQWGDSYDSPPAGTYYQPPRRRSRDAYYRDDGNPRAQRRYAPQPEPQRQFYWPWEDRPQQAEPAPVPTYRAPRPRSADAPPPRRAAKRPVRPAPVAEPAKPAGAKTEPAVQIAVFGDSLADHLARGLAVVFEDKPDIAVVDRAKGDSGLVRKDVVDWPKAAEDYLKANPKVRYAVVLLGANDRQAIREGDQSIEPLTDRWKELYRGRVEAFAKVVAGQKIPLIWVGLPPMRSEALSRDFAAINDVVRDVVTKANGSYVDVSGGFVDDGNRYAASGPDLDGQTAKLRTSDGVHFTRAGDRKLAHFVDVELKRLMGADPSIPAEQPAAVAALPGPGMPKLEGGGGTDDTAAIDRQITAMLPSLPEPPGVPSLPVKPAAGPVVPLGRPETSPGGTLLNGRPREGDAAGTRDRTLQRGAAPISQPGRADDFRWPPG